MVRERAQLAPAVMQVLAPGQWPRRLRRRVLEPGTVLVQARVMAARALVRSHGDRKSVV